MEHGPTELSASMKNVAFVDVLFVWLARRRELKAFALAKEL